MPRRGGRRKKANASPKQQAVSMPSKRYYEMKFGSLELVTAAGDLEEASSDKFLVGRLQEDVLMGLDDGAEVGIEWFNKKNKSWVPSGFDATLPVGSLVCSITKFSKETKSDGSVTIKDEAFEYAEKKLSEQLQDIYDEDNDSQFGDDVVTKRLKYVGKTSVSTAANREDDGGASEDGKEQSSKSRKRKQKPTKGAANKKRNRGLNPRPHLQLAEVSFSKKTGKIAPFNGDVERASKEVVRAVRSGDTKALKAATTSTRIHSLHYVQSVGMPVTPLMIALTTGNIDAAKLLFENMKPEGRNAKRSSRAKLQPCALPTLSTGAISGKHANYNRRKVGASRGGREGNNALLYDTAGPEFILPGLNGDGNSNLGSQELPRLCHKYSPEMSQLSVIRDFDEISSDLLDMAEAAYSRSPGRGWLEEMMHGGNSSMARRCVERQMNQSFNSNSFNFLHQEALGEAPKDESKPFSKDVLARSITKKSETETKFSPLACACINPNTAYLRALLKVAPEHASVVDQRESGLVHYAAACATSEPLEYLIQFHSLSKTSINKGKELPLHFAARAARPGSVRTLLQNMDEDQATTMQTAKTTEGFAAIHYAIQTQRAESLDTLQVLLENGSDPNLASTAARNKVTPMHLAARFGDLHKMEVLVEHGGNPSKGDKLGRSPLSHACLNGHAHIVSFLLRLGVDGEAADSSDNRPFHYAAAYGWDDCAQLLLDAGAHPDPKNSWKTSALSVAIQKGHHSVSAILLNLASVDVNFKDDDCKSLLFRLVEGFIAKSLLIEKLDVKEKTKARDSDAQSLIRDMPWALKHLLERKDLEVATVDADGQNLLHLLCIQSYPKGGEDRALVLAKHLSGIRDFDLAAPDLKGNTPLLCAAKNRNFLLMEYLINQGAILEPTVVDDEGKNMCHHLLGSGCCKPQLDLIEEKSNESVLVQFLSVKDGTGFTPVHVAVQLLTTTNDESQFQSMHGLVRTIVERFPQFAVIGVGPIGIFCDSQKLAAIIASDEEEEKDSSTRNDQRNLAVRRRQRNSGGQESSPEIQNRSDPHTILKALKDRNIALSLESEHHQKCLVHFVCSMTAPYRIKRVLEWLLPISQDVIKQKAGSDCSIFTPMQILLFKVLPSDLFPEKSSGDPKKDRADCLGIVFEAANMMVAAGCDINENRTGMFPDIDQMKDCDDGGGKEHTEAYDIELVNRIKLTAKSMVTEDVTRSVNDDITDQFRLLMDLRKSRIVAKAMDDSGLHEHIATFLSRKSVLDNSIWRRLLDDFRLDLNACDKEGATVLHLALRQKAVDHCQFLCERCPDLMFVASSNGERPIHLAAKLDDSTLVKLLFDALGEKKVTEVNARDDRGCTAFHFSVEKAALRTDEVLEPCEILFMKAGARLDVADYKHQRTPLHYCFLENPSSPHVNFPHCLASETHDRVELASSLLASEGALEAVSMRDSCGRTPLFCAAAYNATVASLLLVSKGADLFETDCDGNTPMNVAILRGHETYVITMMKSVDAKADNLADVFYIEREERNMTNGEKETVVTKNERYSLFGQAIRRDFRGLAYILLDASFPLHRAAVDALNQGSFQLVRKLFTTSPMEIIQYVDPQTGRNLLHEVANVKVFQNRQWSTTLAESLISSGLQPSAKTNNGLTVVHIAASNSHLDLIRFLTNMDKSTALVPDKAGCRPLSYFMRSLPTNDALTENECLQLIDLLTQGMGNLNSEGLNQVRIAFQEPSSNQSSPHQILFEPGPNRGTVTREITKLIQEEEKQKRQSALPFKPDDPIAFNGYSTLLVQAMRSKKRVVIQKFLDAGAPIDMLDSRGLAALHYAVTLNLKCMVLLLLRNGANVNVETGDDHKNTPLLLACSIRGGQPKADSGDTLEIVQILVRFGAELTRPCSVTGMTALHIACNHNDLDVANLIVCAVLDSTPHASTLASTTMARELNTEVLVRFHCEAALVPGKIQGEILTIHDDQQHIYSVSQATEMIEADNLKLDSLAGLIRLYVKQEAKSSKPDASKDAKIAAGLSRESGRNRDATGAKSNKLAALEDLRSRLNSAGEDDDPFRDVDSDDGGDEYEEATNLKPWQKSDHERLFSDSDDESNDSDSCGGSDDDEVHAVNYGTDCLNTGVKGVENQHAESALLPYYGLESLIIGCNDKSLSKPLVKGESVIIQHSTTQQYASNTRVWLDGRVTEVHKNGTYDVEVCCGPPIRGVIRQHLRPCKTNFNRNGKIWKQSGDKLKLLVETKDARGRTPLMIAVKPVVFGSYESFELANLLINSGAKIDMGALSLARVGSKFKQHLAERAGISTLEMDVDCDVRGNDITIMYGLPPLTNRELDSDSKLALVAVESIGILKRTDSPPKINPSCETKGVGLRVLPESSGMKYFDVVMAKVEMNHYHHSENKYYKTQVIENHNKGLYVVLTNWGQVGDYGGQKQETPFGSKDEAVSEFVKIFKAKTGNAWSDFISGTFTPKIGKYKPVKILPSDYRNPKLPDVGEMVDSEELYPETIRLSALPGDIAETVRALCNPREIVSAASNLGLQQDKLPLGRLSISTILASEEKLIEVEEALRLVKSFEDVSKLKEKREAMDKVAVLSSQFYEMLPTKEGDQALAPLTENTLKAQRELMLSLKNLTVASQIVITASVKASEMNPFDYAYRAMGAAMRVCDEGTPERTGIEQYFRNTSRNNNDLVINQVFALNRPNETSNRSMSNHRLLWHGSHVSNLMGIMKEGLRVAPSSAIHSGNAFGDGVYFADMVSKSWGYCRANWGEYGREMPRAYLLLADVALGKQDVVTSPVWEETEGDTSADSVFAAGYEGPDVRKDIVFHDSGVTVPLGEVVRPHGFEPKATWKRERWSWHSEPVDTEIIDAIEKARSLSDTTFPAKVQATIDCKPVDIHLEHGPMSNTAKVTEIAKLQTKSNTRAKKKRKGNDGTEAIPESSEDEQSVEQDEMERSSFEPFTITRSQVALGEHIHHNEYIVNDTNRINLRYLVEVTSRGWLENKLRKEIEGGTS